jgi:hypothetical protein
MQNVVEISGRVGRFKDRYEDNTKTGLEINISVSVWTGSIWLSIMTSGSLL